MSNNEPRLFNTPLALVLSRVFALLIGSLFALYAYSWFASNRPLIGALLSMSALLPFLMAFLPTKALDRLLERLTRETQDPW